jgi:CRISPR/Cas system CSM-associated protein Csm3 (group 7 of RAMP superfamily)
MKNLKYKIEFHTYWHCGSGLAAGADLDSLVVKDSNSLPYVPGKTIKGLVSEAVVEIRGFQKNDKDEELIDAAFKKDFGYFDGEKIKSTTKEEKDVEENMQRGGAFFTNAELLEKEKNAIVSNKAQSYLYTSIASTALNEKGVAKDHSLRSMQVTVPCTLYGEIQNISDEMYNEIKNALKYIKRLGQNRNRGLGRCTIQEEGGEK